MAEIYQLPENGNNNGGVGNIPFSIPEIFWVKRSQGKRGS